MGLLVRPAGQTSWTDQLDGPVLFIRSLGQFAYSKIFLSVCTLSQLPRPTKALFFYFDATPSQILFYSPFNPIVRNKTKENLTSKIKQLNSTDNWESCKKSHGSSNSGQFCDKVCLFIPCYSVKCRRAEIYPYPVKWRFFRLISLEIPIFYVFLKSFFVIFITGINTSKIRNCIEVFKIIALLHISIKSFARFQTFCIVCFYSLVAF